MSDQCFLLPCTEIVYACATGLFKGYVVTAGTPALLLSVSRMYIQVPLGAYCICFLAASSPVSPDLPER